MAAKITYLSNGMPYISMDKPKKTITRKEKIDSVPIYNGDQLDLSDEFFHLNDGEFIEFQTDGEYEYGEWKESHQLIKYHTTITENPNYASELDAYIKLQKILESEVKLWKATAEKKEKEKNTADYKLYLELKKKFND